MKTKGKWCGGGDIIGFEFMLKANLILVHVKKWAM